MSVHVLFADLSRSPEPRDYMTRKLLDYFSATPETEQQIRALAARSYLKTVPDGIPVLSEHELPPLSEGRTRYLDEQIARFKQLVDRASPLIDGEELLPGSDRCTILKTDYRGYPAGTPVLIRETTFATLYYLYGLAQVGPDGRFSYLPDDAGLDRREQPAEEVAHPAGVVIWVTLLTSLAEGLVEAIGGKIGSELLDRIFPGGTGFDPKAMLEDFAQVVKEANKIQTISENAGSLNGILDHHAQYYLPRKHKDAPKKELYELILGHHTTVSKIVGTLQYRDANVDYTKASLPVCILAMGTMLAFYQEMALEDPNSRQPRESSNVDSIRIVAPRYADYATERKRAIVQDRLNERLSRISDVLDNAVCEGTPTGVVCKHRYFFVDDVTGYRSRYYEQMGCHDDPEKRCAEELAKYVARIRQATQSAEDENLKWIEDVATAWRALVDNPLGKPASPA